MSSTNNSTPGAETMGHKASMAIKGAVDSVKNVFHPPPQTIGEKLDSNVAITGVKIDEVHTSSSKSKWRGGGGGGGGGRR